MTQQAIRLFITGGTIDKDYNPISGELGFANSHLDQLLTEANTTLAIEPHQLMLKDSLEMNEDDRLIISKACQQCAEQHIVITHGTDTMTLTAQSLLQNPQLNNKTIVLTGAMRPFKLSNSDAAFNIGSALMAVQLQPPGVYICMNGKVFNGNKVIKDKQAGQFTLPA